jgi:hypothetical protein
MERKDVEEASMGHIGAVFYVLWGLLHLVAAYQVFKLARGQTSDMVQGRLYQNAWNLACIAVAVIAIAVVYNWNNSLFGYWLNLVTTSITDIGFVLFIIVPRYLPLRLSIPGPALWILASIASTVGTFSYHI